MDTFELEQIRKRTIDKLNLSKSPGQVLFILHHYFNLILSTNNELFISSYLIEFIEEYISALNSFDPFYKDLGFTNDILNQAVKITKLPKLKEFKEELTGPSLRIKQRCDELISFLKSEPNPVIPSPGISFPVLEDTAHLNNDIILGFAETVSVTINKSPKAKKDVFIIVPSSESIEQKISEQIKTSWNLAKTSARKYIHKIADNHKVVLQFENRMGDYIGDSLGAALTLVFLEELLKFYDSAYKITPKEKIAITGGLSADGAIKPVSERIIKQKTKIIFYSDISTFVVPKGEDKYVQEQLNDLQNEYPARNIEIIEAKNFNDILNRRDLVSIKREKTIVRSGKFVLRNWVFFVLIIALVSILTYLMYREMDNNPYLIGANGYNVLIENKSGKVLWTKRIDWESKSASSPELRQKYIKIVDLDGDGSNEVLICGEVPTDSKDKTNYGAINCYDSGGKKIIWSYMFADSVRSQREILNNIYGINMIDTFTVSGEKRLALYANNRDSFASAVFCLDLKTGKKVSDTFWCSGFNVYGFVKDIDNDGKPDIVAVGVDNGFEQVVVYGISIDKLSGYRPSTDQYNFLNMNPAKLIFYIRFPKTDYTGYLKLRTDGPLPDGFRDLKNDRRYKISLFLGAEPGDVTFDYKLDYNLKDIDVIIGNAYRVRRDSLVAHGILSPPYTDTQAYKDLLKSKILYWTGTKWVHIKDLN